MIKQKKLWDNILTVIMALLCLLWIYPIVLILLNSLKKEGTFTTSTVFQLPTSETFAGLSNYVYGVIKMGFLSSLGYSLVITVSSVALILLCCSMTGWYLTRVNNKLSKFMNLLIVFSMVVPFQMVMFTLSKTADTSAPHRKLWSSSVMFGCWANNSKYTRRRTAGSMGVIVEVTPSGSGMWPSVASFSANRSITSWAMPFTICLLPE